MIGLLLLAGCAGDSAPEGETASAEQSKRQRIVRFWQLQREANRLRLAGDFDAAIESFEAALEINPSHEDSLYYLGISLEEVGEYARAEEAYRRILELAPNSNHAVTQLADLKATVAPGSNPDFEEARKLLERSIAINREHSGPYLRLGRLALMEGDAGEAIRQFETAAGFGSAEGDLMVGFTLLLRGDETAAANRFQAVIAAAERERARTASGGKSSEGDVRPAAGGAPASPVQSAAARAEKLLALTESGSSVGAWRDVTRAVGLPSDGGRAAWADYDGDGWTDALVAGPGPARLYRNGHGRFQRVPAKALDSARGAWDAAWGDSDGDGDLDLYLIRPGLRGQGVNQLLRNDGGGAFVDVTAGSGLEGERSTYAAAFGDLDGDGRSELIESGSAGVRIYRQSNGSWKESSRELGVSVEGAVVDFELSDYNGDGRLDLFLLPWRKNVRLYLQGRDGRFTDATEQAGLDGVRGRGYSALTLDYDRDGGQDLAWADSSDTDPATLRLFLNTGEGAFQESRQTAPTAIRSVFGLAAGDLDGDERPDILLAGGSLSPNRIEASRVLLSQGGSLELPPSVSLGGAVVDIDRDGRPEVYLAANPALLGSQYGRSRLLRMR